jgi:hypothetical protein
LREVIKYFDAEGVNSLFDIEIDLMNVGGS